MGSEARAVTRDWRARAASAAPFRHGAVIRIGKRSRINATPSMEGRSIRPSRQPPRMKRVPPSALNGSFRNDQFSLPSGWIQTITSTPTHVRHGPSGPDSRAQAPLLWPTVVLVSYAWRLVALKRAEAILPGDRRRAHRRLILVGAKSYFPWDLRLLLEPDPSATFVLPKPSTPLGRNRTFSELTNFFRTDELFQN